MKMDDLGGKPTIFGNPHICHPLFMDRNAGHLALVPTMIQQGQHRRPNSHDLRPRSPGPQGKTDTHNVEHEPWSCFAKMGFSCSIWEICFVGFNFLRFSRGVCILAKLGGRSFLKPNIHYFVKNFLKLSGSIKPRLVKFSAKDSYFWPFQFIY